MIDFYAQFVGRGDLAFDVGAYRGSRTAAFRQLNGRVVAVEPVKESWRALFVRFHDDPLVTIVPRALGAVPGEARIAVSAPNQCASSLSPAYAQAGLTCERYRSRGVTTWSEERIVRVTTLDALIAEFGVPAFTKIDVEGREDDVLHGLSQPLPALSFEFHPHLLAPALRSLERLRLLGSWRMNFVVEEQFRWELDRWVPPGEMAAVLERDRGRAAFLYGDVYARLVTTGESASPGTRVSGPDRN